MMDIPKQHAYFVVLCETHFRSFADAQAQAPDAIAAHIARSRELHAHGTLLLSGAFLDEESSLQTMAICTTREAAEEYITGDPFVKMGKVKSWTIREWANMFA